MARDPLAARTFLALPLSEIFLTEIRSVLAAVRPRISGVRWVPPEQTHLTLHFFGPTMPEEIDKIKRRMKMVAADFSPMALQLSGLGCFPDSRRPRVIWIGLAGATEELVRLQSRMEEDLKQDGFASEERSFQPHLTLGRVKGWEKSNSDFFENLKVPSFESRMMDRIVLYQSHLMPQGPQYEILETFYLSKKPNP